ncbi:DNA polymerase IV [Roseateles chitinivorans]|uniref:DNA polymerase IV n=1 Tax=Roseateles chitinivorans TaxID=2917965 RepID=A0A2G9C311_9BURK|nr:DNA polymerase IV [Roseateles chitinivorans]PIM50755.1 DNA polymerase IV [Roseateles chitinivorans]
MAEPTPALPDRLIAHLDMDAFYASVELLRYPELQGLPVVVGGRRAHTPQLRPDGTREFFKLADYTGRGVVTTSTYAARALGVFSAMGLMKAALRAPQAILLPADFDSYRHYSRLFKAAVREIAPVIEDRGIDEIYIDLTDVPGAREPVGHDPLGGVRAVAREIKNSVQSATGLTCSIGVTPNKLLSKIASELDKPDGLTLVTMADLPTRIWPLPVRRINGIGPKAGEKLDGLGIHTIGELAAAPQELLQQHFGPGYSAWLHQAAWGLDDRPVVTHSEPVSISRETTFERDLHARRDRPELSRIFTALCEQLASDLQRKGYLGRTIGIKLRFEGFRTVTRDLTLDEPVQDAAAIRHAAGLCLKRVDLSQRLRLLGVRVGKLSRPGEIEPPRRGRAGGAGKVEDLRPAPENLSLFG